METIATNSLSAKLKSLLFIGRQQQGWVARQFRLRVVVPSPRRNLLIRSLVEQNICALLGGRNKSENANAYVNSP